MRNEEDAQVELPFQVHEQVEDLSLDGDIQRAHHLVADQRPGMAEERPRKGDALALASRRTQTVSSGDPLVASQRLPSLPRSVSKLGGPGGLLGVSHPCRKDAKHVHPWVER